MSLAPPVEGPPRRSANPSSTRLGLSLFGTAPLVLDVCFGPKGETCGPENSAPWWLAVLIFLAAAAVVFLLVSISEIVKEEPPARRRAAKRRPAPRPAHETTADRLERAAEFTQEYQRPFAGMNIRTVTGKLTFGSWISRWWASGSYMRRRLLVSVGVALLTVVVVGAVVVLIT